MRGTGINPEDMGAIATWACLITSVLLKALGGLREQGGLGGGLGPGRKGGGNIWVSVDIALMKAGIIQEKGTLLRTILEV